MSRHAIGFALILIFYFITTSLSIIKVPIFEASDEAEHFIYIHTILETGELPIIQSREEMANQTDPILRWNNQSHHAPLYYMMSSALVFWSERADIADYLHPNELIFLRNTVEDNPNKWLHRYSVPESDTHIAVYLLRIVNMLIGAGTLIMVYLSAIQVSENRMMPLLAMLLTASIPTFIVVNSSVTNDAPVIFLYSAGIYWVMKVWQNEQFRIVDIATISLILAGIALTKLTGVTLFGVIYTGLIAGILRKKWGWQDALKNMAISGISASVLAGWWYLRNLTLYGDLLAVDATASIWGRETPLTLSMLPDELLRIGKSFWMMVGYLHFPVFAPDAFYIFMAILTVLGLLGLLIRVSHSEDNDKIYLLLFACFVVSAMLLYGTFSVDISYGRLLLPAIAGFAPLMVIGWIQILRRLTLLFILPLSITALIMPLLIVPDAYPSLQAVDVIPENATVVNWQSGNLEILAIDVDSGVVHTGDSIQLDLYFQGNHPDNPALTITAVDTIRGQRFDHIEIFPGMADMRYLPDEQIFLVHVSLDLSEPDTIRPPRVVNILLEWVDLDTNEELLFDSGLSLLEVASVTFVDKNYQAPTYSNTVNVNFGGEILLRDYTLPDAQPGETIPLSFIWESTENLSPDNEAILTMQLFDSEGNLVTQNDGTMWWYPTTSWAENIAFEDSRSLEIPADADIEPGNYELRIGWYRVIDEIYPRLEVINAGNVDNLYSIPIVITAD